jgi:single-stranded-DNA-specific exonuclease
LIHDPAPWLEPVPLDIPADILDEVCGNVLIAGALLRRGIKNGSQAREFLDPVDPGDNLPFRLPGMQQAVERIQRAIHTGERIGIWGDFDVDGQTSTAILLQSLRALEAQVDYHLPVRGPESHGIFISHLMDFLSNGIQLLVTCDTGISELDAAAYCQQAGVDLIVTDHHTLPKVLPSALALINPHFLPESDSLAPLCGAGTAFQLARGLLSSSGSSYSTEQLLDLAALGTLADVAGLWGENRFLVKHGLEQLRTSNRMAIRILLENAKCDPAALNEDHVNFLLAPRLNAVGRLTNANPVVEFLLSEDAQFVNTYALQIEGLNGQRRILLQNVESAALQILKKNPHLLEGPTIVLSHPLWPGGVLGLVAGHLANLYQRPAFVFRSGEDGIARGSARSVANVDIIQAITRCSDLMLGFGGHPKAAGLSLHVEDLPRFQARIDQEIISAHPEGLVIPPLEIEAYLGFKQINPELADQIDRLAPFGEENPEIILAARNAEILNVKTLGKNREHSKLTIRDETGDICEVLHWQSNGMEYPGGLFDLAYTLKKGNFQGKPQLTCEWAGFRQVERLSLRFDSKPALEVVDQRQINVSLAEINSLVEKPGVVIFREGSLIARIPAGIDRRNTSNAEELVISAPPPDWETLSGLVAGFHPEKVIVFDIAMDDGSLSDVMNRLAGLIKYVINAKNGQTTLTELAIQCAQTVVFIQLALDFVAARGDIEFHLLEQDLVSLSSPGHFSLPSRLKEIENALIQVFQESRAFRDFFRSSDLNELFNNL